MKEEAMGVHKRSKNAAEKVLEHKKQGANMALYFWLEQLAREGKLTITNVNVWDYNLIAEYIFDIFSVGEETTN